MSKDFIKIRGARQHNLKNIDIDIPKNSLVVFTGVSGSGKSSLAHDTIYAEGQRKYVESLSTYARQFLGVMKKPDVDLIEGLSPAISIDQKTVSHNPRSTVGTVTEIYDYLRLLFARVGHPHCPLCGREISSQSIDQIVEGALSMLESYSQPHIKFFVLAPVVQDRKGEFSSLFENLKSKGFRRVRIDGQVKDLDDDFVLIKTNKHTVEAVVDRISLPQKDLKDESKKSILKTRLTEAFSQSLSLADGLAILSFIKDASFEIPANPKEMEDHLFSEKFACPFDNISLPEIEPRTFSFNSPHGACKKCGGIGKVLKVNKDLVFAPQISILEGGIVPFASIFEHDTWFARLIKKVCHVKGIDITVPIKTLTARQKEILLEGTGSEVYVVEGTNRQGRMTKIEEKFRGLIRELEEKYNSSDSDYIKTGIEKYMTEKSCEECGGARLNKQALSITIDGKSISEVSDLPVILLIGWVEEIQKKNLLNKREKEVSELVLKEIESRLSFLDDVGLGYLTLSRTASTLSGGEAQRIRLASQIGSGLTGVLYVLDEPTIGLHQKDNALLIATLKKLRDLGNTVIVVEHDRDVMEASDYIFDFGPSAGKKGGALIAQGPPDKIKKDKNSTTGDYLSHRKKIDYPSFEKKENKGWLRLFGASEHNLKNVDLGLPLGKFVSITGVSGSGKSTLIVDTLYHALARNLYPYHKTDPGKYSRIEGLEKINKVILIDQSPIGRTPRSNPATYTKVFDQIRDVFANTREAKAFGFDKGRFSFNVKGGRCDACEGQGKIKIEMQFMPDIWVDCDVCKGARYNSQTLEVTYKGKNISEVLDMTVEEAVEFFHVYKNIVRRLQTLKEVGLGYMELGQSATTLSGGEAQRVKLASELSKKQTGDTVYILDEPTTGLHFKDLENLIQVLKILVERGNTVVVIEHNLDVIKNSDWIIDLGPDGGDFGGKIVAQGSPESLSKEDTHTAKYLSREL